MAKKNFKLYYTPTEVAKALGEEVSTIYYWERAYSVKLHLSKKGNKRYREEEFKLMRTIHYLVREKKLTSEGVKKALRNENLEQLDRHAEAILCLRDASETLGEMIASMDKYRQRAVRRTVLSQSTILHTTESEEETT